MSLLTPAEVVGPGYALDPGFIPGSQSWPGMVPGINLAPEGFFSLGVGPPAVAQALTVSQLSAVVGTLTPDSASALGLAADAPTSAPLPPASAQGVPLVPA